VGEGSTGNGIRLAALGEYLGLVARQDLKHLGARSADAEVSGGWIVRVSTHLRLESRLQRGLLLAGEYGKITPARIACPPIQAGNSFTMQPVCRPIRGNIGAVAPDGADLLSPEGLPDALPALHGAVIKEHLPVSTDHLLRDGRRLHDRLAPDPTEHGE